MKNAAMPNINGIALGKATLLLAAIALAGFGVVPVLVADHRPRTETIAPPSVDPNWLLVPEPAGLEVARQQADLFADEIHRTLIQSEAARIVSKAHAMVGDPAYTDCYNRSIDRCFDSIEQSIREEWLQAIAHDEKIRVLFRWQALQVARTGNVEPPVIGLDGTFLQLIDKLEIERRTAMSQSVEGASRTRQVESQLDQLNHLPANSPGDRPEGAVSDDLMPVVPSPAPAAIEPDASTSDTGTKTPPDSAIEAEPDAEQKAKSEASLETESKPEPDTEPDTEPDSTTDAASPAPKGKPAPRDNADEADDADASEDDRNGENGE